MESGRSSFEGFLSSSLAEIERDGLLRSLRRLSRGPAARVISEGRELVNFSSNDYLGLASHPALVEAAMHEQAGSGASRLVCGTLDAHARLEDEIAAFKRTDAALAFSSGYAAAMGTIPAICSKNDVIILDKLSHACLVDAAKLSGAVLRVFPHNDVGRLESHLKWAATSHPRARVLVVMESVYSMDGDLGPLAEVVELKERHGAWLFLDEAHGVGVLGERGRGLVEQLGLEERVEVQMGTLGKALGSHGAYIAGTRALRDFLLNRARSFIYSTAPPPMVAASAAKAVEIVGGAEGAERREALWRNIRALETALGGPQLSSAIVPIICGGESHAVLAAADLLQKGFLVPAIRYPTVARGKARLRVTLSANHSPEEVSALAAALNLPAA